MVNKIKHVSDPILLLVSPLKSAFSVWYQLWKKHSFSFALFNFVELYFCFFSIYLFTFSFFFLSVSQFIYFSA